MPVLSRRDQPQYPGPAVPVRHERRRVGGHRARRCRSRRGSRARAGGRRNGAAATSWTRSATWSKTASSGGRCQPISRPIGPSMTCWSLAGDRGGRGDARRSARPVPHRGRAQAGADRGGHRLPVGQGRRDRRQDQPRLRRGKEDQRPQAAHRRRHHRAAADRLVTAAGVQDRDAARPLLWNLRKAFPSIRLTWADSGYAGKLVTWAKTKLKPKLTCRSSSAPRPAQVHRAAPPLGRRAHVRLDHRSRRTVRDYERLPGHHETMVYWAMTIIMTRRLARYNQSHQLHPT